MTEVKYETAKDGYCLTPCPYDQKIRLIDRIVSAAAGSIACEGWCDNFVSIDSENKIVTCKGDEE